MKAYKNWLRSGVARGREKTFEERCSIHLELNLESPIESPPPVRVSKFHPRLSGRSSRRQEAATPSPTGVSWASSPGSETAQRARHMTEQSLQSYRCSVSR